VNLTAVLVVAGALPVGWGAALAARRLAGRLSTPIAAMILVEVGIAASAVGSAPAAAVPVLLLAGWTLGLLAVVDLLALRLPDVLTAPLGLAGLALAPRLLGDPLADHLAGAAVGFAALALLGSAYAWIRGRDGLGLGDAKLLAVAGAWLGWRALPIVVVMACAAGLAWAAVRLALRGRAGLSEPIAFGAPLCGAIWICLLLATSGGGLLDLA
jgi:leader peptidase (prepilin peptidase) / N-methyltransferase